MVSRTMIVALVATGVLGISAGVALWSAFQPPATSKTPASETDQRKQAEEFFGKRKEYDLKGGQEMRPRW